MDMKFGQAEPVVGLQAVRLMLLGGDEASRAELINSLAAEKVVARDTDYGLRAVSGLIAGGVGSNLSIATIKGGPQTDVAIILADAEAGLDTATKHHVHMVSMLGIRDVVFAVYGMERSNQTQQSFKAIESEFQELAAQLTGEGEEPLHITAIPVSRDSGSHAISWYRGATLANHLQSVGVDDQGGRPLRMLVQHAEGENGISSEITGVVASGGISAGDRIKIMPAARERRVEEVSLEDNASPGSIVGRTATLHLAEPVDAGPGSIVCAADDPAETGNQFDTTIIWLSDDHLLPGRSYLIRCAGQEAQASATIKYKMNIETLEHLSATHLERGEIAECNLAINRRIAFDPFSQNRDTGSFVLCDRLTKDVVGCGIIQFALRRSANVHWQAVDVTREARAGLMGQRAAVLWFTGLSGSGKSTIANLIEKKLAALGRHTYLLDGDNVRHGLNKDLGFSDEDRVENIRRISEVTRLMADAGLITLVSFISPFKSERRMAREMIEDGEFLEVHVNTPLEVAEARDVKGLYKKARAGEIKNFTGIDSPYEPPDLAEVTVDTSRISAEEAADAIIDELERRGMLDTPVD